MKLAVVLLALSTAVVSKPVRNGRDL